MIDPTIFRADHACRCSPYLCPVCRPVRPRWQIVRDHAAAHRLSVAEVAALVAELPGGGNVVRMEEWRR